MRFLERPETAHEYNNRNQSEYVRQAIKELEDKKFLKKCGIKESYEIIVKEK